MPFTFSHPAIILPFAKLAPHRASLTGLIAGSISPDFEYFLRMRVESIYSHTLSGLFWFNIPLGLALAFIFHLWVKADLIRNLPFALQKRLYPYLSFDWNRHFKKYWPVVVISVLAGAASHLFWDAFTHQNGYFTLRLSWLNDPLFHFPLYKLFQHFSTIAGAVVIIFVIRQLPALPILKAVINYGYWFKIALITFITLAIRYSWGLDIHQYGHWVATLISGGMLGLVLAPVFSKIY